MIDRQTRMMGDPAEKAANLLLRLGIAVLVIGIPCASVVSRRPIFVLMPVGCVLVILGSLLSPGRASRTVTRLIEGARSPLGLVTLFLLFWAGLSLAWTPFPDLAFEGFLKSAGTVLLATATLACLPEHVRTSNANLLPIGLAAASLAVIVVAVVAPAVAQGGDFDTSTIQRATIGLVVLVWPALGALAMRERVAAAGVVAVAVAIVAVAVWSPLALAALIVAILAFSFAYTNPERTGQVLAVLAAALILAGPAIPVVVAALLPARIDPHGLFSVFPVWSQIVKSDGLRLITGHGFDSATRAFVVGIFPENAPRGLLFEVWFELGVVGAAAAAALAGSAFIVAGRASRVLAPFLLAALTCIVTFSAAGLSMGQLWWLTTLVLAAISFAIVMRGQHRLERVQASFLSGRRQAL